MAESPLEANRAANARDEILLSIVYSLYRTIYEVDRWPLILSQIQDLLSARAFCLAIHDFQRRSGKIAIHSGCFNEHQVVSYNQTYGFNDPWLNHQELYGATGLILLGDELISQSRLTVSDFHRDWLQPQNLLYQCSGVLVRDQQHLIYLRAYRSANQLPFKRHELYPLQRLLPHLRQTLELRHMAASSRSGPHKSIIQFVAELGASRGIRKAQHQMLINRSQYDETTEMDLSSTTTAVIQDVPNPATHDGEVAPVAAKEQPDAEAPGPTGDASSMGFRATLPQRRITDERALTERGQGMRGQRWLPILLDTGAETSRFASAPDTNSSGVSTADCATELPATGECEQRLKQLYNLTPSEAKLAELIASGTDLPKVAMLLGIGLSTVRTHLQRIYGKTDTHHQSELVALLLAGPARLRVEYHRRDEEELEHHSRT